MTDQAGTDTLVRMINQIASGFGFEPVEEGARHVAEHLRLYWHPSMRADLLASTCESAAGLSTVAHRALDQLRSLT